MRAAHPGQDPPGTFRTQNSILCCLSTVELVGAAVILRTLPHITTVTLIKRLSLNNICSLMT